MGQQNSSEIENNKIKHDLFGVIEILPPKSNEGKEMEKMKMKKSLTTIKCFN